MRVTWPDDTTVWAIILSRPDGFARRAAVREVWQDASRDKCRVIFQFVVCNQPPLPSREAERLNAEVETFRDIQLLDCKEGYGHGMLVQKVLAGMKDFLLRSSAVPRLIGNGP